MAPETVRTLAGHMAAAPIARRDAPLPSGFAARLTLRWTARLGAIAIVGLLVVTVTPSPAHAIRVTTWNLFDYPNTNLAGRQPHLRTVMQSLDTDIIMLQELKTSAGADSFLLNVLRVANPTRRWMNAGFLLDTESAIFYDSLKVAVSNVTSINTGGVRNVYQLVARPLDYTASAARLRLYSVHFKAGTAASDSAQRRTECTNLRTFLNNQSTFTPTILVGGDTNFYGDFEGGYQVLLADQADDDGRLKDSVNLPGTWNQFAYRCYHSQSPCASPNCPSGYSFGGLDDRFDFFMFSYPTQDFEKVDFISQFPYGNDCSHYDESVDQDNRNSAVPISVATALRLSSDHLPVVATLQLPAKIATSASQLDFGTVIIGAPNPTQNLTVSNAGTFLPIDELDYSFTMPGGYLGPAAGSYQAIATNPGNVHPITLDVSSEGVKGGAIAIASDDVDSLTKFVLLSGTVLRHATASLDSSESRTAESMTFGLHGPGGFSDLPVRIHNVGYDAMQARLSVSNAVITGGGGRFTIAGGFSPGLVSGTARTLSIHFDDTGAAPNQYYTATLTITSADEPLPGATARPNLVVTLRAFPSSTTDATEVLPTALAFLPARPNPIGEGTTLRFELPRAQRVSLQIFDLSGRRVAGLAEGLREAGRHDVRWNATDDHGVRVGAGLYFARFSTPGLERSQRLIVLP